MARPTFGEMLTRGAAYCLAMITSGKNPDGTDAAIPVSLTGDVELGAVEIKNATDDTRATVGASGLHVDVRAISALPAGTNNIGDVDVLTQPGAANIANGQVTAGSASGPAVAARATRRSVLIRNTDTSNSAYVGTGAVSAANGFLLKAGESITIETTAAINCIRAAADVVLAFMEVYD
jgi:hypothetical protein